LRRYIELAENATAIAGRDEMPPAFTFLMFDESLLSLFGTGLHSSTYHLNLSHFGQ
jgi:hypothetical protein